MKPFREQFVECREQGFHGKGEKLQDDEMPLVKKVSPDGIEKLRKLHKVACLRFGGHCNSGHEQCREMRSLS